MDDSRQTITKQAEAVPRFNRHAGVLWGRELAPVLAGRDKSHE